MRAANVPVHHRFRLHSERNGAIFTRIAVKGDVSALGGDIIFVSYRDKRGTPLIRTLMGAVDVTPIGPRPYAPFTRDIVEELRKQRV